MANEKTPVVWDDTAKKHRPLGSGEKMGGLSASSMISSDSGNLLQQGSDGLMLVTGGSIADPRADNLLEESDNGKLQVTSDRVVEWLEGHPQAAAAIAEAVKVVSGDSGNVIVAGTDKGAFMSKATLASAVSTMSATQLATLANALRKQGGGLSVGSDGKLSVDFASMDPAIMRAVVLSMVQQGGGIGVDQNGQLYVDFDSMPTDKFEAMLKSLKMLVPLSANKNIYVSTTNSAADDTIIDGRGTAAKPFKTIQAAVNYATGNYSVGNYHINIRVVAGTYNENVTLPDFSRGTGYIAVLSDSGARDVIVNAQTNSTGMRGTAFACSGGAWRLYHMDARRVENPTTAVGAVGYCYTVGDGDLYLYGCAARQSFPNSPSPIGGNAYGIRILNADGGGALHLMPSDVAGLISAQAGASGDPSVDVISVSRGGTLWLHRTPDESLYPYFECSGSCGIFLNMWQVGAINTVSSGTLMHFTGTMTGKRYSLAGGSHVSGTGGSETFFPGDEAGTVQESTYCWYA